MEGLLKELFDAIAVEKDQLVYTESPSTFRIKVEGEIHVSHSTSSSLCSPKINTSFILFQFSSSSY